MANFQARIKSEYRRRFPHFKGDAWYDIEPARGGSKARGADLFGNRIVRVKMGDEHTSMRADYFEIRVHPKRPEQAPF